MCTSSGSSFSDSDVKPETSANKTVTCLRSPESAVRSFRIRSARWAGVYAFGVANRSTGASADLAAGPNAVPHAPQNFLPGGTLAPHAGHSASSRAPHSSQKLTTSRLYQPQDEHCIVRILPARAGRDG